MRHPIPLLIFLSAILFSCSDTSHSDKEVEQKAYAVIKLLDNSTIDTFRHWGYGTRGKAEIWSKLDTPTYACFYFDKDKTEISVGQIENFKKQFPYNINIDTSIIRRIIFKQLDYRTINVSAWTNFGSDTILNDNINLSLLFPSNDPYEYFARLSKLKNDLGIIGTFYRPDIGNFIQFYLTNQHVLTYFPDTLEINPKFRDVWIGYFSSGKNLLRNWNLRKLENSLDNG